MLAGTIVLSRLEKLNEKTNIRNMNLYNYSADEVEKIGKSYDILIHIDKKAAREREAESDAKLYKYQYTYNAC